MGRYVERVWQPKRAEHVGRHHRRPVRIEAYVPNLIAGWDPPIGGAAAGVVNEADRAVHDLNRDAPSFPGLEALSRQLLRQESIASSRIEGLEMGQRRLARAASETGGDDAARQIVGNIRAMEAAIALASQERVFTFDDLLAIHRTLLGETRDARLAGVIRTEQNWLGGRGFSPVDAEFIPPPASEIEELLGDLVAFTNRTDLPATLHAAALHAQFETVHPFMDGNGRVGRCLIHVALRRGGVAPNVVPPVSLVLAANPDRYIRGLDAWRGDDPVEWCLEFATVTMTAVREARRLAARVRDLHADWLRRCGRPRRDATARRLAERLASEPIVTVKRAMQITGASRSAAAQAIARLARAGILVQLGSTTRNRQWEAPEVFELLDDFERDVATPKGPETR